MPEPIAIRSTEPLLHGSMVVLISTDLDHALGSLAIAINACGVNKHLTPKDLKPGIHYEILKDALK